MINESKILELIKRQKDTGLNITAFCANEGIPKSSYYYWRKRLRKEPGKGFIPLLVNNTPATMSGHSKNYPSFNLIALSISSLGVFRMFDWYSIRIS